MPHPQELVDKIKGLLVGQYPEDVYRYSFDKRIDDSGIRPDIIIRNDSNTIVCAVEIGYTRPEKLTAYREEYNIPDVRWYDKTGKLHGDVLERCEIIRTQRAIPESFYVYQFEDQIDCEDEDCINDPDFYPQYYNRPDFKDDGDESGDKDYSIPVKLWTNEEMDFYVCARSEDVYSVMITDMEVVVILNYCDKCGNCWMSPSEDETDYDESISIVEELLHLGPSRFGLEYGARKTMKWEEIQNIARLNFGIDLDIADFFPITKWSVDSSRRTA